MLDEDPSCVLSYFYLGSKRAHHPRLVKDATADASLRRIDGT
jgi:hypothetical protein